MASLLSHGDSMTATALISNSPGVDRGLGLRDSSFGTYWSVPKKGWFDATPEKRLSLWKSRNSGVLACLV